MSLPKAHFDGDDYQPELDFVRLTGQILRVWVFMRDGGWRTLHEIADATYAPEASVSAQLRNLRKERFGRWEVQKRRRGDKSTGLYEYRMTGRSHVDS